MPQLLPQTPVRMPRRRQPAALAGLGLGIAAVLLLVAIFFLVFWWPFRLDTVTKELADESDSAVTAGSFRATYFPHPGCVLEQVIFQHNPRGGAPPLITIKRITIRGTFAGMFARHVQQVLVEGLHILEVASRQPGTPPLRFVFQGFTLSDAGSNSPAVFKATLSNPEPPGDITTTGKFGPWNADNVGQTAVSGDYRFENADLGRLPGISGVLASSGKYAGTLEHIEVEGSTDVPLFAVVRSSHHTDLQTQFHAIVNAENGDVSLQNVNANFGQTGIWAQGQVAGEEGQDGKTTLLTVDSKEGKIQDLLLLFTTSPRAPMSGMVSFHARVSVPPGEKPFLKKMELQGDFGVDAGSFTKTDTQQGLNSLSRGARGEKNPKPPDQARQ
jgi:hypothetical protein